MGLPGGGVDIQDWKMLKGARPAVQALREPARGPQPAPKERGKESWAPMEALRKKAIRRSSRLRSRFPKSDWTVVGITAAYLLTAPSQQLADMPAVPPPNEAARVEFFDVFCNLSVLGCAGMCWCQSMPEHIKACSLEDGVLHYVIVLYCFVMLFGCCLRPRFGESYCCLGRLLIFSILGTNAGDCW